MNRDVQLLASLYFERKLNEILFESKGIPQYTYEKADADISREIDRLEPACYICAKAYPMAGDVNGFIENAPRV